MEIFHNRMTLVNDTGNVAIGINKVYGVGQGVTAARKEFEIVPDVDFECGGNFVIFADGSDMGVLTRNKTMTNPAEVIVGVLVSLNVVPSVPSSPSVTSFPSSPSYGLPETTGFSMQSALPTPQQE